MAPRFSFRPAAANDLDRLVDIHASAFPDSRDRDARARHLTYSSLGGLEDLWVASAGGTVVAHAFLFSLQAWFGGKRVHVGGIASVGVAPEARGQGIGSALVGHLNDMARARGDAVTVLYPLRRGFYQRLGYVPTSAYHRLRFAPSAIQLDAELHVRAATGADRDAMSACWEATGVTRTGTLWRSERTWDARLIDERRVWLVVEGPTGLEGYVAWTLVQQDPIADPTLVVREVAARTPAGQRSLWGVLRKQQTQVAQVQVDVPLGDPLDAALLDVDRSRFGEVDPGHAHQVLGELVAGPILRVLDASHALGARGWVEDGELVLQIGDDRLHIAAREGTATVRPTRSDPDLWVGHSTLAAVAYGSLPVSAAARLGWLKARDARAHARAEAMLSLPAYFSTDAF